MAVQPRLAAFTALLALGLSGCLVSDAPLLTVENGRAAPLEPGGYQACTYSEDEPEPNCTAMTVDRDAAFQYTFRALEDDADDVTYARFRALDGGAYAAQLNGADDSQYYYFYGARSGDDFTLVMILCEDLPAAFRADFVERGDMQVDKGASTCTASTLEAVSAAALEYARPDGPAKRSRIVLRADAAAE